MDNILIASGSDKGKDFFKDFVSFDSPQNVVFSSNSAETSRILDSRPFDLCIINSPLSDTFGTDLAIELSQKPYPLILFIVKNELSDELSETLGQYGIFVLSKPFSRQLLFSSLKLISVTLNRIRGLQSQNDVLLQRIEDIRLANRAKNLLVFRSNMTEAEAHKYIEKKAMDSRVPKSVVARGIIDLYK